MLDLGDDERWIGGGGSQWYPDAPDAPNEPPNEQHEPPSRAHDKRDA